MTREDFENGLIARLEDIRAYYKTYNPAVFEEGNRPYLSMSICGNIITANNTCYRVDENNPDWITPVDCWKISDQDVYHNSRY